MNHQQNLILISIALSLSSIALTLLSIARKKRKKRKKPVNAGEYYAWAEKRSAALKKHQAEQGRDA